MASSRGEPRASAPPRPAPSSSPDQQSPFSLINEELLAQVLTFLDTRQSCALARTASLFQLAAAKPVGRLCRLDAVHTHCRHRPMYPSSTSRSPRAPARLQSSRCSAAPRAPSGASVRPVCSTSTMHLSSRFCNRRACHHQCSPSVSRSTCRGASIYRRARWICCAGPARAFSTSRTGSAGGSCSHRRSCLPKMSSAFRLVQTRELRRRTQGSDALSSECGPRRAQVSALQCSEAAEPGLGETLADTDGCGPALAAVFRFASPANKANTGPLQR
jgi:hypothetical protein